MRNPRPGCVDIVGGEYEITEIGLMHVLELSSIGASITDIAKYLRVSRPWVANCLDETSKFFDRRIADVYEEGESEFKKRLRQAQANLADTNAQMAIHLGKHYLEQKDVQHVEINKRVQIVGTLPDYGQTAEDWARQFAPTPLQQVPRSLEAEDVEIIEESQK